MTDYYASGEYQAQARIITRLNEQVTALKTALAEAERKTEKYEKAGRFYLAIQKIVQDSPYAMSEWTRFLMALKLADEDAEQTLRNA